MLTVNRLREVDGHRYYSIIKSDQLSNIMILMIYTTTT